MNGFSGEFMVSGRPGRLRSGTVALVVGLLLAGCSGEGGGDGDRDREGDRDTSATDTTNTGPKGAAPSPSASTTGLDFSPDESRVPKTRAAALRLARSVAAEPSRWGTGYVKRSPYESDPSSVAVLDEDCVWQREPLPPSVLAGFTRHSELPAQGDKGPIRIAATVIVHREEADANWEMARTLEEALRCPEQRLSADERITGLLSAGLPFGVRQFTSDDSISESGEYHSDELGGPHHYTWGQSRLGKVTISAVGKGSDGRTAKEIDTAVIEGTAAMLVDVQRELEGAA